MGYMKKCTKRNDCLRNRSKGSKTIKAGLSKNKIINPATSKRSIKPLKFLLKQPHSPDINTCCQPYY